MIITVIITLCFVMSVQVDARSTDMMEKKTKIRRVREENDVYGTQLNGNSLRAPLWPQENSKMFLLPRNLNTGDRIIITGPISDNPKQISIGLFSNNGEIEGQLELYFPSSDSDKIVLRSTSTGEIESQHTPTQLIPDYESGAKLNVTLDIQNRLDFYVGESFIPSNFKQIYNIDSIQYLQVLGDIKVDTLEFQFT